MTRLPVDSSLAFSIIAFNDEASIEPLIHECDRYFSLQGLEGEIFVVDDGSRDRTRSILQDLQSRMPRLKLLFHDSNLGFGPTIRDAYFRPAADLVFLLPGDGQIAPGEVERLRPLIGPNDLILGWRRSRQDISLRQFFSYLYNVTISLLLGRRVRDVDSVALINRTALSALKLQSNSAFIHAELVLEAQRFGFRWGEQTIQHRPRQSGSSGAFRLRVMVDALHELCRYVKQRHRRPPSPLDASLAHQDA